MPAPLIPAIMIISALASLAGKGIQAASQAKHVRDLRRSEEQKRADAEKDQRRAALMRAVRADTVFKPRDIPVSPVYEPNAMGNILSGLGQFSGQMGAMGLGNQAYPTA